MDQISAQEIRNIIFEEISAQIMFYRTSKNKWPEYEHSRWEATEEEIDDFIFSNPYYDIDLVSHITDPGLLGYSANNASISENWKTEFISQTRKWKNSYTWKSSSRIDFINHPLFDSVSSEVWTPNSIIPPWLNATPSYILMAQDIIGQGRCLSEMHWRDFEKLIGSLLENSGWIVEVTRGSKDGGVDVIAKKEDSILGEIKTIWQAKKYKKDNFVSLSDVRELSAVRDDMDATKGIIVTTSRLTKGAIHWIKKDLYRLDFKEREQIEAWILSQKISL